MLSPNVQTSTSLKKITHLYNFWKASYLQTGSMNSLSPNALHLTDKSVYVCFEIGIRITVQVYLFAKLSENSLLKICSKNPLTLFSVLKPLPSPVCIALKSTQHKMISTQLRIQSLGNESTVLINMSR